MVPDVVVNQGGDEVVAGDTSERRGVRYARKERGRQAGQHTKQRAPVVITLLHAHVGMNTRRSAGSLRQSKEERGTTPGGGGG
jgi:hypothetical protein